MGLAFLTGQSYFPCSDFPKWQKHSIMCKRNSVIAKMQIKCSTPCWKMWPENGCYFIHNTLREVQKCSKSDSYVFDSAKKDIKASLKKILLNVKAWQSACLLPGVCLMSGIWEEHFLCVIKGDSKYRSATSPFVETSNKIPLCLCSLSSLQTS